MDSETTAQARLRIGDLGGSQLRDWVNEQLYQRATSLACLARDIMICCLEIYPSRQKTHRKLLE